MKKGIKILGVFLGILIILLALSPLFLKGTLEKLVQRTIDNNLNADVAWNDFDLSLFSNFPNAALTISDFSVVNRAPFAGDTLAKGERVKLNLGIRQLLKTSDDPIKIDGLLLEDALVDILIDSSGITNYDIAIKKDAPLADDTQGNAGFSFDLKKYEIKNSRVNYLDQVSQTFLRLEAIHHEGKGDFSLQTSQLDTETQATVSLAIDGIEYLDSNQVALDAVFQLDLENQKYTFLENEAKVNELPLTFKGFVQVNEDNNEIDLTFKTPSSDFKNFLAVIPKAYVKEINSVETTGDFVVDGTLKGFVDDNRIPTMDIKVTSANASFKYPNLPKAVRNIAIDAVLKNETGIAKDTYLNIGNLSFKIDNELFSANGSLRNLTENIFVNLALKGTLNLANIEQVLPLELEQKLSGVFTADVTTNFDMNSVEKAQYQNIKSNGTASIRDFVYNDGTLKNDMVISNADVAFNPETIQLQNLTMTTGNTDVSATGTIENLIPFLLSKQDLKGDFDVTSNTFNVSDFMMAPGGESSDISTEKNKTIKNEVKIPDFLDARLNFAATKVVYDDITLTNAKGTIAVENQAAQLRNVTSSVFGGNVTLSGNVSTKNETPTFDMNLDLKKISISESFRKSNILKYLAPIASALEGNINTTVNLNGNLSKDLQPILTSLAGDALAQILTAEINPEKAPVLSGLSENLEFLNLNKLSLQDVSTLLKFDSGNIVVQPFDLKVKDMVINVNGRHGLDTSMDYKLTMDVPARYLGSEVSKLLSKLDPKDANTMTVTLPVGINGTLTSPKFSVDTKAAVSTLTQKLIDKRKQDLLDKGQDILQDILGGGNTPTDSTQTPRDTLKTQQNTTQVVTDILGNIFGKKNKKTDSTNNGN